jgi:DNA-binding MarR family transcriptional regulator
MEVVLGTFLDKIPVDVAIWRVGHLHRHLVTLRLESLGLYRGQHRLITTLGNIDGLTHSELAESLRISNATVSKMVQRMEQHGFVERCQDQNDQRISRVFLTEKGHSIHQQMDKMFVQLQKDELEGFSDEEVDQLMVLLEKLNANFLKHLPQNIHNTKKQRKHHHKNPLEETE